MLALFEIFVVVVVVEKRIKAISVLRNSNAHTSPKTRKEIALEIV